MKFAIGLMACIAIAFVFVTSPDSQPRASVQPASVDVQSQAIASLTQAITDLQISIADDREALEDRMGKRLEARFVAFTETLPKPAAMPIPDDLEPDVRAIEAKQAELEKRIAELEQAKTAAAKSAASCPCPDGACPCPVTTKPAAVQGRTTSRTVTSSGPVNYAPSYTARWQSNDGRSLQDHATQVHGFNPNLSDAQLAAQHDAYHDQYGGASPSTAMRSRSVTVQSPFTTSNCPGGQCPTAGRSRAATVQRSGGLLGFGILGRKQ